MKVFLQAALVVILAIFATIAPAREEGVCSPSSNCVGVDQGIDSNKAASGSTPPSYTFISTFETTASGAGISQAFALGSNPTCRVVVSLIAVAVSSSPFTAVSMGGTSLTQDATQGSTGSSSTSDIWSGNLASCTGSQTLSVTSTGGSFTYRAASVWVATNLTVNGHVQVGGFVENVGVKTPTTPTISVTANDLMFGTISNNQGTAPSCAASTQSPHALNGYTTDVFNAAPDWVISATNASFSINCSNSNSSIAVAVATFH